MSCSLRCCTRCTAGCRHDGANLSRCASSSTPVPIGCGGSSDHLRCLCRSWVQERHDFGWLIVHRSTALRLDPCTATTALTAHSSLVQQDAGGA